MTTSTKRGTRAEKRHAKRRNDSRPRAVIQALEPRLMMSTAWQNVQIGGGGFVTSLANSTGGDAIYARTDVGGAYRWDAGGNRWAPITDGLPNDAANNGHLFGIGSIAVDAANANRVFIAGGKFTWSNPSGVYVSTNANAAAPTWTAIDSTVRLNGNGGGRNKGERLAVDPNNSNVVYYGTNNISGGGSGLRKYVYNGTSWSTSTLATPAVGDANYGIVFAAVDKNGGTVSDGTNTVSRYQYIGVYSATAGNGGVYASSDGGASWTKVTGIAADKPARGEVATDGMLWVTHEGGVAKVARGSTAATTMSPVAGLSYNGLAIDPTAAGTVMVAEVGGSQRIWRTTNGSGFVLMTRNVVLTEPDGTPSVTRSNGNLDNIADVMINPANPDEVWVSDFLGVVRTQNVKDDTTASTWYNLQKGHEEVVPLALASAPAGAPLLSATADVNGYVHNNVDVRPSGADRFESPTYLSTTSLDFSEADTNVWARVGDIFYTGNTYGGTSINGGRDWAAFGQLDAKPVANSPTAGWETWDVGAYLARQKALGVNTVTLVVTASAWQQNQHHLKFSSREGANAPQVLINGSASLSAVADAMVYKGNQANNYGNTTELQAQNYYDQNSYTRRSYIKFDLSSVGTITSAKLRLFRMANATDTTAYATAILSTPTTSWTEGNGGTDNNPTGEITWTNMPIDYYAQPSGAQGGRVAVSATDSARLVWTAENGKVYYSANRGVTWAQGTIGGNPLTLNTLTQFEQDRLNLAADRVAANTFYAYANGAGGTIYRSIDGGATWASMATSTGSGVQYKIEAVPGQSGRLWLMAQNYNVASSFRYWNGTAMVTVPGMSGAVDFSFGKAAPGRTNAAVYVRKSDGTYWYSVDATAGTTFTWQQMAVGSTINDSPRVMEADRQTFGRVYVATDGRGIFYADAVSSYAWDGGAGGSGTSWNTPANWSPDNAPTPWANAVFGGAGLSAGKVIALDANQTVDKLTLATTTGFTVGSGATYGLSLARVDRQDVAGTEANQTIAAPITLTADSVWTVDGSGALIVTGGIAGAFGLNKLGAGQLNLGANTYSGSTTVSAGTLRATANGAVKGNLIVGGGAAPAAFVSAAISDAIANGATVTVNVNGTVSFGAASENINSLVINGGAFNSNYSYVNGGITMTGGTLGGSGPIYGTHTNITSNASTSIATIGVGNSLNPYLNSTFTVADGAAPVDLKVTGNLFSGGAGQTLTKAGAGVLSLHGASTHANGTFTVANGTLLVNNATGSGTGQSAVVASATSANATVGGIGTIGGVAGYTNANLTLTGNSTYTATLAPGTVNESTGADVLGTLTVGSAAQSNNVTFNAYSRLAIGLSNDAADRLTINGNLAFGATNTTIAITATGSQTLSSYTIASWTGTLSGTAATVVGVPDGYVLVYGPNSIVLQRNAAFALSRVDPNVMTSTPPPSTATRQLIDQRYVASGIPDPVPLRASGGATAPVSHRANTLVVRDHCVLPSVVPTVRALFSNALIEVDMDYAGV